MSLQGKVTLEFWGVSSLLCVEKTNIEINISHETTTIVVWIYDDI